MTLARTCPALFLAAPASGQGKTTLVAPLARHHSNQGRRVRVFKTGPDFLDPMNLGRAAGTPVESLDLWMVGETDSRRKLYEAAGAADPILIEGPEQVLLAPVPVQAAGKPLFAGSKTASAREMP